MRRSSTPKLLDTEVLIVGSGAGGATTAALLAEAGFGVLVAEEGPWVEQGAVTPFSLAQMDAQYRSGGLTAALGLPSIAYTEGRCAGGGTEVNSGLYRRPPGDVVDRWRDQWRIRDLDPDELTLIAEEVEKELSVGTVPGAASEPSQVLERGAERLGWQHSEIPRWMTYPEGTTGWRGDRQSMTRTYLPRAMRAGAIVTTGLTIDRLVVRHGRAIEAEATEQTADGGRPVTVRFRHVVVCGGAIQTAALLQRSGIRRHVGRTLAVHPTVKLAARFGHELNVPDDVPVHQVKEFTPALSFGGSASNPGLVALALSDQWGTFGPTIEDWRSTSVYYAAITSEGKGLVQAIPGVKDPLVTYRLTGRDKQLLRSGLARLTLLMLAAGAQEVYPSFRGAPVVRRPEDVAALQDRFAAARAPVMTVHLCSTAPLGEDRDRCAVDSFGRVHDSSNIHVNDASLLPDAPGVNPQGSVMALAIRNARRFIASERPRG